MRNCEGRDVVLVLAAGRGVRMGGPKALMMVGGRAWWRVQQERLASAGIETVWVVSREVGAAMRRDLRQGDAAMEIAESDPGLPMFASVAAGIRALVEGGVRPSGVFVLPVDVPAAGAAVWRALAAVGSRVAVPEYRGRRGHPVRLMWEFVERVIVPSLEDAGFLAQARLDRLVQGETTAVPVEDEAVVVNLNDPADVERWRDWAGS